MLLPLMLVPLLLPLMMLLVLFLSKHQHHHLHPTPTTPFTTSHMQSTITPKIMVPPPSSPPQSYLEIGHLPTAMKMFLPSEIDVTNAILHDHDNLTEFSIVYCKTLSIQLHKICTYFTCIPYTHVILRTYTYVHNTYTH